MAKYTAAEIEAMGKKGQAFKNPDGSFSYPVGDVDDLGNAIRAVGRGGADHDAIRKYIIGRAKALGQSPMIPDNWNADGSLSESNAARTPLELLRRRRGSMIRKSERRGMLLEMRTQPDGTGGTEFVFEGYGATFDTPFDMWDPWGDPYTEVVRPGAFTRSLDRPDLDVPFLIGHDDSRLALARTRNGTMRLAQDSRGLLVEARMDGRRSDVRDLAYAVERGDQDEMSIGFVTEQQHWSEDYMTREMLGLNIHRGDVSSVSLAANPSTAGSTMTAAPGQVMVAMPGASWSARWQPGAEQLASRGEVQDNSNEPDSNVPAYDPSGHGAGSLTCTNDGCRVYQSTGERAKNARDAQFCDQCGGPLYDGDGLMVLDDSGVVEEVNGAMGDANLLAAAAPLEVMRMRTRMRELAAR